MRRLLKRLPKKYKQKIKKLSIFKLFKTKNKRIFVRMCHDPLELLSPLASTKAMGGNQGNLLYQFSVYRSLCTDKTDLTTITYEEFSKGPVSERARWINDNCDHLVLPLSSSFRLQNVDNLHVWAELIERLNIPVTVVGIGAQIQLENIENRSFLPSTVAGTSLTGEELLAHQTAVIRFIKAVLKRSKSVGVRGQVTKDYLVNLGFAANRIDVIGCPSLFMWGRNNKASEKEIELSQQSLVALSYDHRVPPSAKLLEMATGEFSLSTVYMQEKLGAQMLITGKDTRPNWKGDKRFPMQVSHNLYNEKKLTYFASAWGWVEHLKKYDFGCGARLHGTVAAILAGVPAHLLVHDSRTYELAQYHKLPFTYANEVEKMISIRELADRTNFDCYNREYASLFDKYIEFLTRNSLENAYSSPNKKLKEFDVKIRSIATKDMRKKRSN